MNTLGVIALSIAIAGAAANWAPFVVDPTCTFNPQEACDKCPWDISWLQFVADGCDCRKYYMCEKDESGNIIVHNFTCNPCMCFSNKKWACSIQIDECPTNPPPTIVPIPTIQVYTNCFCMDFDGDAREHTYYKVDDTCCKVPVWPPTVIDSYYAHGWALESHGAPCHAEIPYFQNAQFRTFSFCGMFFPFSGTSGTKMGLAYNGWSDDCAPGSIQIFKDYDDHVVGGIRLETNRWFFIRSNNAVAELAWHKVCLIYNGRGSDRTLTLTIDNGAAKTIHNNGLVGLTALEHCNMRIGEVMDFSRNTFGFRGLLDTWCFSENLIRRDQCADGTFGVEPNIQVE